MIQVTDTLQIDAATIEIKPQLSSGPGGQNVNSNKTAVQLRFDLLQAYSLPYEVQQRLLRIAGCRLNSAYQIVITARRHRSQERNKREAMQRLFELIRKAAETPKPRIKRQRSQASQRARLDDKHKRAEKKRNRRAVSAREL
ncbi:MAG: alternative ribosome rescue aminoacyl-tRNA hydrolase ArfB [Gammaproteobacteria bacterium]